MEILFYPASLYAAKVNLQADIRYMGMHPIHKAA